MSPARITLATALSLLAMPCLGFGVFGMLASFEPPGSWGFFAFYAVLDLGILAAAVLFWRWALSPARVPGTCARCGYPIQTITAERCPECGTKIPRIDP